MKTDHSSGMPEHVGRAGDTLRALTGIKWT